MKCPAFKYSTRLALWILSNFPSDLWINLIFGSNRARTLFITSLRLFITALDNGWYVTSDISCRSVGIVCNMQGEMSLLLLKKLLVNYNFTSRIKKTDSWRGRNRSIACPRWSERSLSNDVNTRYISSSVQLSLIIKCETRLI